MSYAMRGMGALGLIGMGVDVPLIGKDNSRLMLHPEARAGDCASAQSVQQMLKDLGFDPGSVDGNFTAQGFDALKSFASVYGVRMHPSNPYPTATICQALINAWLGLQAKFAQLHPPPPPVAKAAAAGFGRFGGVDDTRTHFFGRGRDGVFSGFGDAADYTRTRFFRGHGRDGVLGFGAFGLGVFEGLPTIRQGTPDKATTSVWQTFLGTVITPPPKVDGVFGSGTKTATVAFQKAVKLTADGVVGKNTWEKAAQVVATKAAEAGGGSLPAFPGAPPALPPPGALPPLPPAPAAPPIPGAPPPSAAEPGGGGMAPIVVPPEDASPVGKAKAWWGGQTQTAKAVVMGGGILTVVALAMIFGGGPKAARPPGLPRPAGSMTPNRRRRVRTRTKGMRRLRKGKVRKAGYLVIARAGRRTIELGPYRSRKAAQKEASKLRSRLRFVRNDGTSPACPPAKATPNPRRRRKARRYVGNLRTRRSGELYAVSVKGHKTRRFRLKRTAMKYLRSVEHKRNRRYPHDLGVSINFPIRRRRAKPTRSRWAFFDNRRRAR